ncbi:MAG: hypothetical protein ACR2LI_02400 [Propionibacteriaceae bacterium]
MAHPLELSYRWQPPVVFASVAAIVMGSLLIRSGTPGWGSVLAVVVAGWALFLGVVWLRTRAYLLVEGTAMTVRRYRGTQELDGREVTRVREYVTGHGPCYLVWVGDARRPVHVPTGLLKAGHSTFFRWLQASAPHAELDKRSIRTRERLRERGQLG